MPHYAYKVHNVPGQILSQVPEDINRLPEPCSSKTLKEDTFKESSGCKNKTSLGSKKQNTKVSSKGTKCSSKGTKCSNKITSLDELRMKYSK